MAHCAVQELGKLTQFKFLFPLCLPWRINQHPPFWRVTGSPLNLSPGWWTSSLSISVLVCRFPSITLSGSRRLEAADFTAPCPFYPLCMPRMALKFSSKKAKLWQACGKPVLLTSTGSGEGSTLPMAKCACSVTVACDHVKTPSNHTSSGDSKQQRLATGVLGLLDSAALLSLTSTWSGFQPPIKLDKL